MPSPEWPELTPTKPLKETTITAHFPMAHRSHLSRPPYSVSQFSALPKHRVFLVSYVTLSHRTNQFGNSS